MAPEGATKGLRVINYVSPVLSLDPRRVIVPLQLLTKQPTRKQRENVAVIIVVGLQVTGAILTSLTNQNARKFVRV